MGRRAPPWARDRARQIGMFDDTDYVINGFEAGAGKGKVVGSVTEYCRVICGEVALELLASW